MTILWRSIIAATATAAAASLSAVAGAQPIAIATLPVGSTLNLQAEVIGKVVQEHAGIQVRVIPLSGTSETMAAVQSGEADFTLTDISNTADAINAAGEFSALKPMKDLRIVLKLGDFPVGVIVRNTGPIKKMEDLKGKKFPIGWQAFPNGVPLSQALLAANGMKLSDLNGVNVSGLIPAADDLKAGNLDATMIAIPTPKVRELHAAIPGGIRFLSINDSPEALKRVKAVRPYYGIITVKPNPSIPWVTAPVNVLNIYNLIVTSAKVPDATVYKFIKAVAENKQELVKGHPSLAAFFPDQRMAAQFGSVQYHPGAVKYLKERGFWPGS